MNLEPIATIEFASGSMRSVYECNGRQFIIDDNGYRAYGVWFIPRDEADEPAMVLAANGADQVDEIPF